MPPPQLTLFTMISIGYQHATLKLFEWIKENPNEVPPASIFQQHERLQKVALMISR